MSDQVGKAKPVESFEYELLEVDPDSLRTVVAEPETKPEPMNPWIEPDSVKLKYRIGRGPFGDVRLATHHQSSSDFDRYHELALKVLHPLEKDHTQKFLDKFEQVFFRCRGFRNVCWLHGVSIIDGKICIAMKVYEGSVGDKVARLKGGKLPLSEALKHGIEIAKGILELHSIGVLALNLKPSNILLNDNKEAVLGDFGIPYLLLGMSSSSPEMVLRIGTPNYMAPEQWEPEVRGPITPETDSWGFACCFLEILTGVRPWDGISVEEIYSSVVIKQEKPQIPSGLPPLIECVINGCFEYDLRYRPLAADILNAFESSRAVLHGEDEWFGSRTNSTLTERPSLTWYLSKDQIQVGDKVRSRNNTTDVPEGTVVSLESHNASEKKDSFATVKVPGSRSPVRVLTSSIKRVVAGFSAGDWVSLIITTKEEEDPKRHSSVGIIHSVLRDGSVEVGLVGLETLWRGHVSDLQLAKSRHIVGDFSRVKQTVLDPRFDWPRKKSNGGSGSWAVGRISKILPNGCLVVGFPGRLVLGGGPKVFLADPCQVEPVSFDTCPGVVEKYRHVEDFHWAVRPIAIALGLFAGLKVGLFAGSRLKKCSARREERCQEGRSGGKWLPSLFKDGGGGGGVSAR